MPTIAELCEVERWLESGPDDGTDNEANVKGGFKGFLLSKGFKYVFSRVDAVSDFQKFRPRIELRCVLGGHNTHKALCADFEERNDQWAVTMVFQIVTEPEGKPTDNRLHDVMRGALRDVMLTAAQKTFRDTINFPYHVIAEAFIETGTVPVLKEEDGLEYSTISFSGVAAIRYIDNSTAFNIALVNQQ